MLIGKYLNRYPKGAGEIYVPPGWDEWYSPMKGNPYARFKYILNDNGRLINYSVKPKNYGTDVYTRKAADFIQAAARDRKPFFMYLSTYTPHGGIGDGPAFPAPRHLHLFSEVRAPWTPSFNQRAKYQ
jgi:N-acetylglucosamine-6-sulfatase